MKNENKITFAILKEKISPDNLLAMSELIAISETKYLIGYMGARMQKIHMDLYIDIMHKNDVNHTLSNAYDLVQECGLFLCQHFGKYLKDVIGYTKKGKPINVEMACIRKMMKLINRNTRDFKYTVSLDSLMPYNEPSCEIKEEVEQDYTEYDKIVESLNLTDNMRVALECRIKGLSYPEIGRVLSRAQSTVFEYFIKMRQRYMAIYG